MSRSGDNDANDQFATDLTDVQWHCGLCKEASKYAV